MSEITVGELKQILNKYPDNFKVVISIHDNVGIESPLGEVRHVDYDSVGDGFGESNSSDGNGVRLPVEYCNAIRLIPCREIDFDVFSGDNNEVNNYLKSLNFM